MDDAPCPYAPSTTAAYAHAMDDDTKEATQGKRLAEAEKKIQRQKQQIRRLRALLERAEDAMRAWGFRDEEPSLLFDVQDALIDMRGDDNG